jgi:autophagy-related protein 9
MMTWSEVAHRLVLVQRTTRLCAARDLDELDIVARIMRKENYLIAMLNAGCLALYVRGCGGWGRRRLMLTKTLEWNLYWCVLDPMFDEHFHIKQVGGGWCWVGWLDQQVVGAMSTAERCS